jgi:hypothetical protein
MKPEAARVWRKGLRAARKRAARGRRMTHLVLTQAPREDCEHARTDRLIADSKTAAAVSPATADQNR